MLNAPKLIENSRCRASKYGASRSCLYKRHSRVSSLDKRGHRIPSNDLARESLIIPSKHPKRNSRRSHVQRAIPRACNSHDVPRAHHSRTLHPWFTKATTEQRIYKKRAETIPCGRSRGTHLGRRYATRIHGPNGNRAKFGERAEQLLALTAAGDSDRHPIRRV